MAYYLSKVDAKYTWCFLEHAFQNQFCCRPETCQYASKVLETTSSKIHETCLDSLVSYLLLVSYLSHFAVRKFWFFLEHNYITRYKNFCTYNLCTRNGNQLPLIIHHIIFIYVKKIYFFKGLITAMKISGIFMTHLHYVSWQDITKHA